MTQVCGSGWLLGKYCGANYFQPPLYFSVLYLHVGEDVMPRPIAAGLIISAGRLAKLHDQQKGCPVSVYFIVAGNHTCI